MAGATEQAARIRRTMTDLGGVTEALDALANEGREDAYALRMLSRVVDGAFMSLDAVADELEAEGGAQC